MTLGHVKRKEDEKLAKRLDAQKVEAKEGEKVGECDGRTGLRDIWEKWEENEEQ